MALFDGSKAVEKRLAQGHERAELEMTPPSSFV
jgi:hypothetical protein